MNRREFLIKGGALAGLALSGAFLGSALRPDQAVMAADQHEIEQIKLRGLYLKDQKAGVNDFGTYWTDKSATDVTYGIPMTEYVKTEQEKGTLEIMPRDEYYQHFPDGTWLGTRHPIPGKHEPLVFIVPQPEPSPNR